MTLKILTCGHPKSGLYLTVRIVAKLLENRGLLASYKRNHGLDREIDRDWSGHKVFPEISWLDHIRRIDPSFARMWPELARQRFHLAWPDPRHPFRTVPIEEVVAESSLLWSSLGPLQTASAEFAGVTHRVYSLRDGRDVVVSLLHYLTSDIMRQLGPANRALGTAADALADLRRFEEAARAWAAHVQEFLPRRHQFVAVRFEELVADKPAAVARLAHELGLDPRPGEIEDIVARTTPAATSAHAPHHLRRGIAGDWRNHFSPAHREIFHCAAGDALVAAGYERDGDW
ncbi:MAG: sulfotransferase domain-containing protein [Planctomycetota bacterium]